MTVKTFAEFSNKTELNLDTLKESCNSLASTTTDKYILDKIKAINVLVEDILNYTPKIDTDETDYDDSELISDDNDEFIYDDDEFIEDLEGDEFIEEEEEFIEDYDDEFIDDIEFDEFDEDEDSEDDI